MVVFAVGNLGAVKLRIVSFSCCPTLFLLVTVMHITQMDMQSVQPGIKVFAVEPTGAADAYNSFQKRELTGHTGPVNTVADGLRTTLGNGRRR